MLKKDIIIVVFLNLKILIKRGVGFGDLRIIYGWIKDLWFIFEVFRL